MAFERLSEECLRALARVLRARSNAMERREPAGFFGGQGAGRVSLLPFLPRSKKGSRLPGETGDWHRFVKYKTGGRVLPKTRPRGCDPARRLTLFSHHKRVSRKGCPNSWPFGFPTLRQVFCGSARCASLSRCPDRKKLTSFRLRHTG